jgi:IclR family acetate operon transcriptional repressor
LYGYGEKDEVQRLKALRKDDQSLADRLDHKLGPGNVQSVSRTFELLEAMVDAGGVASLSELRVKSGLPLATIHRLLQTLVVLGYVRQAASRRYALGPRLARLGEGATRLVGKWAGPHLRELVERLGESTNLALLDAEGVLYVAQEPGRHSMRMFTEVGRRAGVHCTAVGKAILARLPEEEAITVVRRFGMQAHTANTITTLPGMLAELQKVRRRGYALDNGEQEDAVRCVAVALPGEVTRAAISISGPVGRMDDEMVRRAVPLLRAAASKVAKEWESVEILTAAF